MEYVLAFALLATGLLAVQGRTYEGYQVIRMVPTSEEQVHSLMRFKTENEEMDFWKVPRAVGHIVDINVSPRDFSRVSYFLKSNDIEFKVMIEDVQEKIRAAMPTERQGNLTSPSDIDYSQYNKLEDVEAWLEELATKYSHIAKLVTVGKTYQGRTLQAVHIHSPTGGNVTKPAFWMDGGIHSREWISPATVIYMLGNMLEGYGTVEAITKVIDAMDFYILPIFNADGYSYTWSGDRLWRKTREPNAGSSCVGTDPNRNWDWHWGESGASKNPCAEDFAGTHAFSQISVRDVADFLKTIPKLEVYINFHSYSQLWMYPWGYAREDTKDNAALKAASIATLTALEAVHGTKYEEGTIAKIIYVASGSTADWTYGAADVKYSFGVELRDKGQHGFLLPPTEIIPSGQETLAGILALANYVLEHP